MATEVQKFYSGQNILITGGTGFLGQVLIQKLLLACTDVVGLYLMVRYKKGLSPNIRLQQIFENPLFDTLKIKNPNYLEKIHIIEADLSEPGLGLCEQDRNIIIEKINIVFHCAAELKMDLKLKNALKANVKGTIQLIDLCHEISNLKSVIYVSTAYSNCPQSTIDEKFYTCPIEPQVLLHLSENVCENLLDKITPSLIDPWPNTYVFTKALAENILLTKSGDLPIGLFRPSIVTSTFAEPIPGWTNNVNGPSALMIASGLGLLRVLYIEPKKKCDTVPVDMCVNGLICCGREVSKRKLENKETAVPVYNFSNGSHQNLTWQEYAEASSRNYTIPCMQAIWVQILILTASPLKFQILNFFLHYVPAYIIDGILKLRGKNLRLIKLYEKIDKTCKAYQFVLFKEWNILNNNVKSLWNRLDNKDKDLFPFDTSIIEVDSYFTSMTIGLRKYIIKEDDENIEAAKKRYKRLMILHKTLVNTFYAILLWFSYKILCFIFYK